MTQLAIETTKNPNFQNTAGNAHDVHYKVVEGHLFSELEEEAVVLNLHNGKYYGLNPVGVTIWRALQVPASLTGIQNAVMSEYEVDEDVCRNEVTSFLQAMINEGLVETSDEEAV